MLLCVAFSYEAAQCYCRGRAGLVLTGLYLGKGKTASMRACARSRPAWKPFWSGQAYLKLGKTSKILRDKNY